MRMLNPPHPGTFIRTEVTEPLGLTVAGAAAVLGVSRPALSALLNGRADLSGTMALRIEKAFGVRMDTLVCGCRHRTTSPRTRLRKNEVRVARYVPVETMSA